MAARTLANATFMARRPTQKAKHHLQHFDRLVTECGKTEAAIRTLHAGGALLDPNVAATVMQEVARGSATAPGAEALTRREREVLALLARGMSNRELAGALFVSEKTIKTHVSNILMKLGVHDRTQAALLAVREGLVDAGEAGP